MKGKVLSAALAAVAALTLTACGKDDAKGSAPAQSAPVVSTGGALPSAADTGTTAVGENTEPDSEPYTGALSDTGSASETGSTTDGDAPPVGESAPEGSSGDVSKPDKPKTVESRTYKRRPIDEHDTGNVYLIVEILDNGGWYMSSDTWAGQTYASYSFEEEAAGAFVPVVGYGAGAEPTLVGEARFTMTEDTLAVIYDDADEAVYYDRHRS